MSAAKIVVGILAALFYGTVCRAHVGSPDVFFEGDAGPYKLLVAIRPPTVIPGIAQVEVRSLSDDVRTIRVLPLPLSGDGAKFPPTPDITRRSVDDPNFFTGTLWMMAFGSWQVRVEAEGAKGKGQLSVPVPAIASNTLGMQSKLGAALFAAMLFLVFGLVSIVGAGVREAKLEPGNPVQPQVRKRSYVVMAASAVSFAAVLSAGSRWWSSEADAYRSKVYKPLEMSASLQMPQRLTLQLKDPGWLSFRQLDDLVPDHGHPMHLFLIRVPDMDRMWHLHPEPGEAGIFTVDLPSVPAGRYKMFGDIVHRNGLAETAVTETTLPDVNGRELSGDDSSASAAPFSQGAKDSTVSELPGGFRMVWLRDSGPLLSKKMSLFRFRLEDAAGKPAPELQNYMGMAGHAEFVRDDAGVFAHVHPAGSVSMAALELTKTNSMPVGMMHSVDGMRMPEAVSFPYGFPTAGRYRIFVQMKHAGKVDTGVFDVHVLDLSE
ncbi:MAG: hypothetical protein M3Z36_09355 [Acidobacteriota bacterium]|nr:hypothetical protein [Acidobacteriota bacterium]